MTPAFECGFQNLQIIRRRALFVIAEHSRLELFDIGDAAEIRELLALARRLLSYDGYLLDLEEVTQECLALVVTVFFRRVERRKASLEFDRLARLNVLDGFDVAARGGRNRNLLEIELDVVVVNEILHHDSCCFSAPIDILPFN